MNGIFGSPARVATVAVAGLLLVAAGAKVVAPAGGAADADDALGPPAVAVAAVWELGVGLWLAWGVAVRPAVAAAAVTFAGFADVSATAAAAGRSDCGCFGPVAVHPGLTAALDVTVVAGLMAVWQAHAGRGGMCVSAGVGLVVAAAGIGLVGVGHGPLADAHAAIIGNAVYLATPVVRVGAVPAGQPVEFVVTVRNRSADAVELIGGTADCTCLTLTGERVPIPPGGSVEVAGRLVPTGTAGPFRRTISLYTNTRPDRLTARITGRLTP